jgi:hypothetical protein
VNEVEDLRKENELLKLNLKVVLEKVRALEGQVAAADRAKEKKVGKGVAVGDLDFFEVPVPANMLPAGLSRIDARTAEIVQVEKELMDALHARNLTMVEGAAKQKAEDAVLRATRRLELLRSLGRPAPTRAEQEAAAALEAVRNASDPAAKRRAADALEKAAWKLRRELDAPARP